MKGLSPNWMMEINKFEGNVNFLDIIYIWIFVGILYIIFIKTTPK